MKKGLDVHSLAGVGILTAVVIALQVFSNHVALFGVSPTWALVPIVVGGALYGIWAGAWLGLVMSVVVLFAPSTLALFFPVNPAATIIIVILKGTSAGTLAAVVYHLLKKKSSFWAVFLAAITCPIVNTAIFSLGANWFFRPVWGVSNEATAFAFWGVLFGVIWINFVSEFIISVILSPTIVQIIRLGKKRSA